MFHPQKLAKTGAELWNRLHFNALNLAHIPHSSKLWVTGSSPVGRAIFNGLWGYRSLFAALFQNVFHNP